MMTDEISVAKNTPHPLTLRSRIPFTLVNLAFGTIFHIAANFNSWLFYGELNPLVLTDEESFFLHVND